MASGPLLPSAAPRTQQSFEPPFEWVRRDDRDTLLLDVSGFKKEQLKVQVSSQGNLKVTGERTIYGNQRIRFAKEFHVPDNCSVGEIRAKFQNGVLYVIMPKSSMVPPPPPPPPPTAATTTAITTTEDAKSSAEVEPTKTWHDEAGDYAGKAMERKEERGDNNGDGDVNSRFAVEAYEARRKTARSRRLIVNTLVVVMVALGIWIYFNYGFASLLVKKHEAASE